MRNVKVPRSILKECRRTKDIHIHQFADASNLACSTATIVLVESETGFVKDLLSFKSRISKRSLSIARLELVSGHMAANMVRNGMSGVETFTDSFSDNMDGQYDGIVLDNES